MSHPGSHSQQGDAALGGWSVPLGTKLPSLAALAPCPLPALLPITSAPGNIGVHWTRKVQCVDLVLGKEITSCADWCGQSLAGRPVSPSGFSLGAEPAGEPLGIGVCVCVCALKYRFVYI